MPPIGYLCKVIFKVKLAIIKTRDQVEASWLRTVVKSKQVWPEALSLHFLEFLRCSSPSVLRTEPNGYSWCLLPQMDSGYLQISFSLRQDSKNVQVFSPSRQRSWGQDKANEKLKLHYQIVCREQDKLLASFGSLYRHCLSLTPFLNVIHMYDLLRL